MSLLKHDWKIIQKFYDAGNSSKLCSTKFGFCYATWHKAIHYGLIKIDKNRCRTKYNPDLDLTGRTFDYLTVIKRSHRNGAYKWECLCKCGNKTLVPTQSLIRGLTKSCGCRKTRKGISHYKWRGIGGIGLTFWHGIVNSSKTRGRPIEFSISMQEAWDLFQKQRGICALSGSILNMGETGEERTASLDRIDSSKGYTIDNVQWVHKHVNIMKGSLSEENFMRWVKTIYEFRNLR